jgi:hypothetical protein
MDESGRPTVGTLGADLVIIQAESIDAVKPIDSTAPDDLATMFGVSEIIQIKDQLVDLSDASLHPQDRIYQAPHSHKGPTGNIVLSITVADEGTILKLFDKSSQR